MHSEPRESRSIDRARARVLVSAVSTALMVALVTAPRAGSAQAQPGDTTRPAPSWDAPAGAEKVLRVCADPDNLPFSNRNEEGFENRIATLLARELGDSLVYVWWPQRRGFVRNTLRARECDVVLGAPAGFDPVLSTKPYYRSTYYLVFPTARRPHLTSLDDEALKRVRVGVSLIGEDYEHTPPVHALLARGISTNVTGFSSFYGEEHRPGEIIAALAKGTIDVAIVWGPVAGYFARRSSVPLTLVALPDDKVSGLPFVFDVGFGVRRSDRALKARLDEIVDRRRAEIERILREYDVPTVSGPSAADKRGAVKGEVDDDVTFNGERHATSRRAR
jgi:quinoprotein dehydrogenase-associated probable ABC transporter substrate-binding protein